MDLNSTTPLSGGWSPVRQWIIPLCILGVALILHWTGTPGRWAYYAVFVSMLFLAFTNPIVNALRPQLARNTGWSLLIFAVHSAMCALVFRLIGEQATFDRRMFLAIVVFYLMAVMLSALFRGVYVLITEKL